jgi:septum formation protein
MKIILASDSPRRKQLLSLMVPEFKAVSHKADEDGAKLAHVDPEDLVGQLAIDKATSVKGEVVIGSDLVVALKNKIMGKPKDLDEAKKFLDRLNGKTHIVYCGVAVATKDKVLMSVAKSHVKMKNYGQEIIEAYIKRFHVLDKGGAYAIQFELPGYGSLVESFKGGITTIIGLPLNHLENLLKEAGITPKANWQKKCREETGFEF